MDKMNFFGQFYGCLGIPNHSRAFAEALSVKIPKLILCPISQDQGDHYGLTENLSSRFGNPEDGVPSLMFWYPDTFNQMLSIVPHAKPRIGYYIFEFTKIPQNYVDTMNRMDGICTASKWGVETLKKNGVNVPCYVVPGGVNSSIFNSAKRELDSKRFRFLHIGKAENRKGTDIVIRAFNEAFKGDRKVRLSLYIDNPHLRKFNGDAFLHELKEHYNLKYPITNIEVRHFEQDITHIYNTHHVAVFASKAEGIGLPIVEAMASGMPVIVPFNSGITEYANDSNAILLKDLKNEIVSDPVFFAHGDFGTWNTPKDEDMVKSMLWAYENYPKAQEIGNQAEKDMKDGYSWEMAADKFLEVVQGV